jgi:hypothetical protein
MDQCDECGRWEDEDRLFHYQGQHLCPACRRGYVLDDLKNLADGIEDAFSSDVWVELRTLISAMEKEAGE